LFKYLLIASIVIVSLGCGGSQTGPDGTEQDAIEAYIEANPNVDDGLEDIDENDDGTN
jgi:hypothetical protein